MNRHVPESYVIWFLFGIFGAHRFYLGFRGTGWLYLCTAGLFGVGWLLDFINIPSMVASYNRRLTTAESVC